MKGNKRFTSILLPYQPFAKLTWKVWINELKHLHFLFLMLLIFDFSYAIGQSSTDTTSFDHYIRGRRTINTSVNLVTTVNNDRTITLQILPTFTEKGEQLNPQTISSYQLGYQLLLDDISISPPNYYKPAKGSKRMMRITRSETIVFEPQLPIMVSRYVNFNLKLNLFQDDIKEVRNLTIMVFLPFVKEMVEEIKKEPVPVEPTEAPQIVKPEPEQTQQIAPQKKTTKPEDKPVSSVSIDQLLEINNQIRQLHNQVDQYRFSTSANNRDVSVIQNYNIQTDQLKARFDNVYLTGTFADPTAANRINSVFSDYHSTTKGMLSEMLSGSKTDDRAAAHAKNETKKEGTGVSNLFKYIIIGLGLLLIIIATVMIVSLHHKKKSLKVQNKLMRKATMEMNKQKFQASKQSRKLKI